VLQTIPLVLILAGLVLYVVLAGADFGAGLWLALSGPGERGARIREHAHHSMAPVWEANHVWLIFVLTVTWTAYPAFFGSVASTLGAALLLAGLGIILRGSCYALRAGADSHRGRQAIDTSFAIASLVTPFALGAAAGAIASERIPVGNATGSEFASWLNPTSAAIGVLAVVFAAYLAAVYLAADAARIGDTELEAAFRRRALGAGVLAGAVAFATLVVVRGDARSLYDELLRGALAAVIASGLTGVATLGLVCARRFELARVSAALAVAAVIGGWALARYPTLLPGLSVDRAAASHDTLVTLIVAVVAGGVLLFPSLGLLFGLLLSGRFDAGAAHAVASESRPSALPAGVGVGAGRGAVALLIAGVGLLNVASAPRAHAIGVTALLAAVVLGFVALVPAVLADEL